MLGCGSSDPVVSSEVQAVTDVVERYLDALSERDFTAACGLLSRRQIAHGPGNEIRTCAAGLARKLERDPAITRGANQAVVEVETTGRRAVAHLSSGGFIRLVQLDGAWRVRLVIN